MQTKRTAPVLDEDQDSIDDETLAELAVDEERLHASLHNPQSIRRSGHQYSYDQTMSKHSGLAQGNNNVEPR